MAERRATSQQQLQSIGARRRRLITAPWKQVIAAAAAAAATSIALSVTALPTAAFLSPSYPATVRRNHCLLGVQSSALHVTTETARSSSRRVRRNVVTDADMLLQVSILNRRLDDVERLFNASSAEYEIDEPTKYDKVGPDIMVPYNNTNWEEAESESLVRKKVRVSMKKTPKTRRTQTSGSRSSTMPGFSATTDKQRAFQDGIRIVEERTGRRYVDSPEELNKRRQLNGEAMYKNSASVPDSMVQFADEIHQEERITRKEEIELGEKTQEAIRLQNLYDVLEKRLGREPTDEEWCAAAGKINMEAIGKAIEEGLEAKNKLVTSNLRMVQSVVNTYIRNGLTARYNAGDLMQDGILALIRAAEKFEPDRGWKFSTYAMYWVRSSVKRSQIYQSRIIRVPERLAENHKRLKRVELEIFASTGKKPTRKELGEAVSMSEEQVIRCMTAMEQRCYSLDQKIYSKKRFKGDNNNEKLIDFVESKVDNEHKHIERATLREDLVEALNRYLSPEEVEMLLLRYGLKKGLSANSRDPNGDGQTSIAALSRMFGLTPCKVRLRIDKSLKQLKGAGLEEWLALEQDLQEAVLDR